MTSAHPIFAGGTYVGGNRRRRDGRGCNCCVGARANRILAIAPGGIRLAASTCSNEPLISIAPNTIRRTLSRRPTSGSCFIAWRPIGRPSPVGGLEETPCPPARYPAPAGTLGKDDQALLGSPFPISAWLCLPRAPRTTNRPRVSSRQRQRPARRRPSLPQALR